MVTLRAGVQIVIESGFSVESGASVTAAIDPSLGMADTIIFDYEDFDYFLEQADGPWGDRSWTYDSIGNRLTETRDGVLDEYDYEPGASGNTPILDVVDLDTTGLGGQRDYTFGLAGHLESVVIGAGASQVDFTTDDEGRLSEVSRSYEIEGDPVSDTAKLFYDGRSFLCRAENELSEDIEYVEPVYSSEGLLHGLTRVNFVVINEEGDTEPRTTDFSLFYFAGRPVAQVKELDGASEWMFLTTDHLGAPLLATDATGNDLWAGPFEPFGRDFFQQAQSSDVFLRLPGQWDDPLWQNPTAGVGIFYNVHRWYEYGTGRYGRSDPIEASPNGYAYVDARPQFFTDPLGLLALDPSCANWPPGGGGGSGGTCCPDKLARAVQQYNEFFAPGWRQRNPECWEVIASRFGKWRPRGGQGVLSPLSCMVGGHRGEVIKCRQERRPACGFSSPGGQTYFGPKICDSSQCPSPLNVLFHEQLHRCGAPAEKGGLITAARDIARTCVGF
jgi:RHS repeat-associated protein